MSNAKINLIFEQWQSIIDFFFSGGTSSAPAVAVKSITAKDIILQEREKKAFFSAHKKKIESEDKIVVLDSPAIAPKPTQMSVAEYKQVNIYIL